MGRLSEQLEQEGRLSQETPQEPGFIQGVRESIQKRTVGVEETEEKFARGEIGFPRAAFRVAGEAAGGVLDIAGKGISAITPDIIEQPIIKGLASIAKTAPIEKVVETYQTFKQKHPEAAKDLESGTNLLLLLGLPKVGKETIQTTGKISGKGGAILEQGAKKQLQAEKEAFARRLTRPLETSKVKVAEVSRTIETGFGPFKKSVVTPSGVEARAQQAILEVPGVSPRKTYQQNYNIISSHNKNLAVQLEKELSANDFFFPKKELMARLKVTQQGLARSPALVGDQVKIADKLMAEIQRRVNIAGAKGSSLLKVRKEFDAWVKSQKPKVFEATSENAFTITNREIRNTINNFLDEKAVNVAVKDSLKRQSTLFDALENIAPKAALEANTAIGRSFQRMMQAIGLKNKIVQQIAAIVGIGGLGAAATFAPAAAIVGIGAFLIFKGGRLILRPEIRLHLGKLLQEYEKIAGKTATLEIRKQIGNVLKSQTFQ